jgi:hypothetical protein
MKRSLPLLALAIAVFGCSSDVPDLVQVQGRVTRGGKPVPGIVLQFQPDDGRVSWGQADAEGKFTLSYSKHYEGARLGKHRVYVAYGNTPETPYDDSGKQRLNPEQQDIIKKYGKLESTPLEVELKDDGQVVEIKLD